MVRVRPGTPADLPALRAVQAAALAEPWPELLDLAIGDDGPLLLVVDVGTPAGYAIGMTAAPPTSYVPEFAIRPDRQGQGLGSRLMATLLRTLADDGFERVRLTARAGDEEAVAFYERHGFVVVECVPDNFEHDDGLTVERRL